MFKLFITLVLLVIANQVSSKQESKSNSSRLICPYPFVSQDNGYSFNNCYKRLGETKSYYEALTKCKALDRNAGLVTPKFQNGWEDLYKLYKAYPNFYFWVGAVATPAAPLSFRWQDGTLVYPDSWCSGHPKGGDNLCAFYTTTALIGRDKCISTGPCSAGVFDHGIICQYG